MGEPRGKAASRGLIGGMTGLVAGQVAGNIIEQERRRRNSVENQLEGGNAEGVLEVTMARFAGTQMSNF